MREIIPSKITAGVSFSARVNLDDYPAGVWALALMLRGPSVIDVAATVDGNDHVFTVDDTTEWEAGDYAYTIRATLGAKVAEVESGRVRILADLADAEAGFDGRSHARICLDAIEAVIAKRATLDQERYRINNRELYRTPIGELLKLRNTYREEVRREDLKARGGSRFGAVKVRIQPIGA